MESLFYVRSRANCKQNVSKKEQDHWNNWRHLQLSEGIFQFRIQAWKVKLKPRKNNEDDPTIDFYFVFQTWREFYWWRFWLDNYFRWVVSPNLKKFIFIALRNKKFIACSTPEWIPRLEYNCVLSRRWTSKTNEHDFTEK